jgi:hypothetical protein
MLTADGNGPTAKLLEIGHIAVHWQTGKETISMKNAHTNTQADTMKVEFAVPDIAHQAQAALDGALDFCAQKLGLTNRSAVADRLRRADSNARRYFEYGLAQQIGEHLGGLDEEVKAVYLYDDEATPEDSVFGESTAPSLVHLIVRAQRKTSALNSLVVALDRAVTHQYADMFQAPQLAHLLDIQVIDEAEVNAGAGYGALFTWLHHRPLSVWTR